MCYLECYKNVLSKGVNILLGQLVSCDVIKQGESNVGSNAFLHSIKYNVNVKTRYVMMS